MYLENTTTISPLVQLKILMHLKSFYSNILKSLPVVGLHFGFSCKSKNFRTDGLFRYYGPARMFQASNHGSVHIVSFFLGAIIDIWC